MNDGEARELKRQNRKFKKAINELTIAVSQHLALLDAEMKTPSNNERGKRIGILANALDMANDATLHFTLRQSFESINQRKAKMTRKANELQGTLLG